jgi:uncharacterized protein (DUF1778 family)
MSRLTVRLPETLHRQLKLAAESEGVSLNQYIVFALAQKTAPSFFITKHSEQDVKAQMDRFLAYLERAPKATEAELLRFLEAREKDDEDVDPEVLKRLEERIERAKGTSKRSSRFLRY